MFSFRYKNSSAIFFSHPSYRKISNTFFFKLLHVYLSYLIEVFPVSVLSYFAQIGRTFMVAQHQQVPKTIFISRHTFIYLVPNQSPKRNCRSCQSLTDAWKIDKSYLSRKLSSFLLYSQQLLLLFISFSKVTTNIFDLFLRYIELESILRTITLFWSQDIVSSSIIKTVQLISFLTLVTIT